MYKLQKLQYGLLAAFAAETFFVTYGVKFAPLAPLFSVLYFFAGIAIAILLLFFPQATAMGKTASTAKRSPFAAKFIFIAGLGILLYYISVYLFKTSSIDINAADMLPVIQKMDQRFINGQWKQVYDTIPEIWQGTRPIYLPATWLPFSVPVFLNADIRWLTPFCLWFVFSVSFLTLTRVKHNYFSTITLLFGFILCWWLMTENDTHGFVSLSEEGIIAFYYTLLVMAILSGNIYYTGIAISLCVLSRYALIGWVPALLIFLLLKKQFKDTAILAVIGLLCFFGLLILPFGWDNFMQLLQLPGNYIAFAGRVWRDSPEVFTESMGFAKFFGPGQVNLLHHLLIVLTFLVPVSFILFCLYLGKKRKISNVALASLKLGVVVFYSFIDVPYLYLFYTSSFISLAAVSFFIAQRIEP